MNYRELQKRLKAAGIEAERITHDNLNRGGCCVWAALVGERLQALGVDVRGVAYANKPIKELRPQNNLNGWDWRHGSFYHVGLRIRFGHRYWLYDSEGLAPAAKRALPADTEAKIVPGFLSVPELRALADEERLWNQTFDRDCIPDLKALVNRELSHL